VRYPLGLAFPIILDISAEFPSPAQFVVDNIVDLVADSSLTSESTVAIVYRTNAQSRFLEEACVAKNLPYVIRGGAGGFYKRAEVKDCMCFLRWMYNGNDESAMIRAFQTPSRGLGDKAVAAFKDYCSAVDMFYRVSLPGTVRPSKLDILFSLTGMDGLSLVQGAPEASEYIPKRALNNFIPFAGQMNKLRNQAFTSPVDSLLFDIIGDFDLLSHFDSISKSRSEYNERYENVQELRRATRRYSDQGPALAAKTAEVTEDVSPLGSFLDDVSLISDVAADDEVSGNPRLVVNLMTIHASKGTEYDAVFVVGNEEGTLPSWLSIQEGEDSVALQEERRLCYVAMTRAKTRLVMTWRKEVTSFSDWSAKGPKTVEKSRSRFLDALVTKGKGEKSKTSPTPKSPLRPTKAASTSDPGESWERQLVPNGSTRLLARRDVGSRKTSAASQSAETGKNGVLSKRPNSRPQAESMQPRTVNHSSPPVTPTTPIKPADKRQTFDSTLFYPVGSDVIHPNFGKGKVLEPPPATADNKSLVRVKFDNGRTMEFPVESIELVPFF
jgi:ATP-dependent exoDNAse (exonuclease V) beta subunit